MILMMTSCIVLFTFAIGQLSLTTANFRLHLLHNSDMHSRFEETDEDACDKWFCKNSTNCFGGFARVKEAANQLTRDADRRNINTVFMNAGDMFQGTPYYTLKKWKIVAPLVDSIGFHITCLGNHEFDNGVDNLVQYLNHLRTPIVCCNLDLSTEKRLQLPNLKPSTILRVGTEHIGVIGYLTPTTMGSANTENLKILDEIPSIRREAQRLKRLGVKIIIALGHSGIDRDKEIAEQVEEISLIVGGHTHTMMYTPKEKAPNIEKAQENYPCIVTQNSGKRVPIVHAYAYTKYLGRLFIEFDDEGNVISAEGNLLLLDSSIPKDITVNKIVESWTKPLKGMLKTVKGYTRVPLLRSNIPDMVLESNAGNFVTDALLHYGVKYAIENNKQTWTNSPIAIQNRDGIRCDINEGVLRLEDLYVFAPFENLLYEVQLSGATIIKALEHSVTKEDQNELYPLIDVAGLKVEYDLEQPVGQRVSSVFVLCKKCAVARYEKLKLEQIYCVIMGEYLMLGGNNYKMFQDESLNTTTLNKTDTDAVIEYIEQLQIVYPKLEGRISVVRVDNPLPNEFNSLSYSVSLLIISALLILLLIFSYDFCRRYRIILKKSYPSYQRLNS